MRIQSHLLGANVYCSLVGLLTGKPVIAGRVNSIGLLLLAFGIHGFESGAARFETFYEGLYKEISDPYNMYVMYYIPELLKNVAVKRKDPSKIFDILENQAGKKLRCSCPYCAGKEPDEIFEFYKISTLSLSLCPGLNLSAALRSLSLYFWAYYQSFEITNFVKHLACA